MSEDWFDRSYRSEEHPPAELDARILAGARRTTRRWAVPLAAAATLTVVAGLVFAALLASVDLDVPPDSESTAVDAPPLVLDLPSSTTDTGRPEISVRVAPAPAPPAAGSCSVPSVLVGPFGGPGRRDRAALCHVGGLLRVELAWDGEPSCPSRLSVPLSADTPVSLDGAALVVGATRYRCARGQWVRD